MAGVSVSMREQPAAPASVARSVQRYGNILVNILIRWTAVCAIKLDRENQFKGELQNGEDRKEKGVKTCCEEIRKNRGKVE